MWFLEINGASVDLLAHRITFVVVAPLLMGALLRSVAETIRQSRVAARAAEDRRLEGERAARLAERTDIAREVHDLVAHHVASIALRTAVASRCPWTVTRQATRWSRRPRHWEHTVRARCPSPRPGDPRPAGR